MKILLVDNYDSYTWNLFQQLARVVGVEPIVVANDAVTVEQVERMDLDAIVLSPGPGHPDRLRDFGVCDSLIEHSRVPILGVCLGHQGLAVVEGGHVGRAPEAFHGRTSALLHTGDELFRGVPQGALVVRYHSLIVHEPVPAALEVTARTRDGLVMAVRHRTRPQWGVQFHPESIATEHGDTIITNFLRLAGWEPAAVPVPVPAAAPASTPAARPVHVRPLPGRHDAESLFVALFGERPHAFWLDSAAPGTEHARYSIIGAVERDGDRRVRADVAAGAVVVEGVSGPAQVVPVPLFDWVEAELAARRSDAHALPVPGVVGAFGYELRAQLGSAVAHSTAHPDAVLLCVDQHVVVDEVTQRAWMVAVGDPAAALDWFRDLESRLQAAAPVAPPRTGSGRDLAFRPRDDRRRYLDNVESCLESILDGESYELCLTTQLVGPPLARPLDAYRVLRRRNPAPYGAYLRFGDLALLSSSPELFLSAGADGALTTKPIKGTRARHADPIRDAAARDELANHPKDRAENLMIVDLLRNDLGRVCAVGSVRVPRLMHVESYETVHQLVSTVTGRLRADRTVVDALRAAFPGGSMTGAPKLRSMEILDRLEAGGRGFYAGSLGRLGADGTADLSIVIRCAVSTPRATTIGVGGAVVALSDPQTELDEAMLKGRAVLEAMAEAETGRPHGYVVIETHADEAAAGKG